MDKSIRIQQRAEIANVITHGLGCVAAIVGIIFLLIRTADDPGYALIAAAAIYGFGLIFTLLASSMYHSLKATRFSQTWKLLDHLAIFFLIAGTNTPLVPIYLEGWIGVAYLIALWSMVGVGILLKLKFIESHDRLLTYYYVLLGWMAVIVLPFMWDSLPGEVFGLIVGGGVAYSSGVYFYMHDERPWNHPIWHLLVLMGAGLHFWAIWLAAGS